MFGKKRYLILYLFIIMVLSAMVFMFLSINSPRKVVYYNETPTGIQKFLCSVRGGKLETVGQQYLSDETELILPTGKVFCYFK